MSGPGRGWVEAEEVNPKFAPIDGNLKNERGRAKAQVQLFPPAGIILGSDAMVHGAEKYGPYNWRSGSVELTQYLAAILRHTLAILDGQDYDEDSNKKHVAHILATAAIIADADEYGVLVDDRSDAGPATQMLRDRA
jgi:dATP/dGTP diphosphohydrolase